MKIWLLNPYGPIPGEGWRDYRFTVLGKALAERGHMVTWWTGNFSHHFKRFRSQGWQDINVSPGFTIRLVPTVGYSRNISLGRLRFEATFAWNCYHEATHMQAPNCIAGTDPSQIIGFMSVRLAQKLRVPLILDVFDLWPELFALALPRAMRSFSSFLFLPLFILRKYNLRHAASITSLSCTYLHIAMKQAPNVDPKMCLTVFNGIDVSCFRTLANAEIDVIVGYGAEKKLNEIWAVYAGSLGNNYDIQTLLHAILDLEQRGCPFRFWIAGDGPLRESITRFIEAHQLDRVRYMGKLMPSELAHLYGMCDIGICPYAPDSNVAMPDKAYDYMAAGLPIVNSLRGELESLLRDRQMGIQYEAGNSQSLADALETLAADKDRRSMMARNSYDAAMDFDQHVQYQKFVGLVEILSVAEKAKQS